MQQAVTENPNCSGRPFFREKSQVCHSHFLRSCSINHEYALQCSLQLRKNVAENMEESKVTDSLVPGLKW